VLDSARLWPSFNVIALDGNELAIDTLSFGWKREGSARRSRRALVRARRSGSQWQLDPLREVNIEDAGPRLSLNAARCHLQPSITHEGRWDYSCEREVRRADGVPHRYVEEVSGLPDARGSLDEHGDGAEMPMQIHLHLDGMTRFRVLGGVFRTLGEAHRVLADQASPFAYLALLNRYQSEVAQLTLRGLGVAAVDAFASATDLGTGLERPMRLERSAEPGVVFARAEGCSPRTLLRIYWRLDRA
jgi:hypothetical protein